MRRPHIIAEQARHARGLLGWIVAFIMARETWAANRRAIEALGVSERDHVLDVGCGHGRSLARLADRAAKGQVVGVDPSDLMVDMARKRNRRQVKAGRVQVVVAGADRLPFADGAFDRALCVHVVYFWPDLDSPLKEIARVLKPGGRLAVLFRTSADEAAVQAFPPDIYRFPALKEMTVALAAAGFSVDIDATAGDPGAGPVLLAAFRLDQRP